MMMKKEMSRKEILKTALLEKYAQKEPQGFIQFDGGSGGNGDDLYSGATFDLMSASPVRVMIMPDMSKQDAMTILELISRQIQQSDLFECKNHLRTEEDQICDAYLKRHKKTDMENILREAGYSDDDILEFQSSCFPF